MPIHISLIYPWHVNLLDIVVITHILYGIMHHVLFMFIAFSFLVLGISLSMYVLYRG
ncbi:hypothetical protein BJV78DRAFT_1260238, partial [Lactifluus subvellereus]